MNYKKLPHALENAKNFDGENLAKWSPGKLVIETARIVKTEGQWGLWTLLFARVFFLLCEAGAKHSAEFAGLIYQQVSLLHSDWADCQRAQGRNP